MRAPRMVSRAPGGGAKNGGPALPMSAITSTSWRSASSPASVNVARIAPLGLRAPSTRMTIRSLGPGLRRGRGPRAT